MTSGGEDYGTVAATHEQAPGHGTCWGKCDVNSFLVPVLLTTVACIYGTWAIVAKIALEANSTTPLIFAFYRCICASILLLLGQYLLMDKLLQSRAHWNIRQVIKEDSGRWACIGAAVALNVAMHILALDVLPSLTCAVAEPLLPVFAGIFARLLGVEHLTSWKICGVFLCTGGAIAVVICSEGADASTLGGAKAFWTGMTYLFLHVAGGALYHVLQKPIAHKYPPMFLAGGAFLLACVPLLISAFATEGELSNWAMTDPVCLLGFAYYVVLVTVFNYSIYAWANRESSPTTVMSFQTLQPVFAAIVSWFALHIFLTTGQVIGGVAIMVGLLVFSTGDKVRHLVFGETAKGEAALLTKKVQV